MILGVIVIDDKLSPVVDTSDSHQFLEIGDHGNSATVDNLSPVTATTVLLTPAMKHLNNISLPTPKVNINNKALCDCKQQPNSISTKYEKTSFLKAVFIYLWCI
jgi:hypothetical protein